MNTQKKEPELNNSLNWSRIQHLLKLGIFAALMVLIGDMLLGYGISDVSLSGLERQLSTYLKSYGIRITTISCSLRAIRKQLTA